MYLLTKQILGMLECACHVFPFQSLDGCFTVTGPKILLLGLGWEEKAQQQKDVVAVE